MRVNGILSFLSFCDVLGSIPTFDTLRNFRSWVNSMAKQVKKVVFH